MGEVGLLEEALEEIKIVLEGQRKLLSTNNIETRDTMLMCKQYAYFVGQKSFENEPINIKTVIAAQKKLDYERETQNNHLRPSIYNRIIDDILWKSANFSQHLLVDEEI